MRRKVAVAALFALTLLGAVALTLRGHGDVSPVWTEFAIGPASGESLQINDTTFRGDGATLRAAIATAHEIPSVRVIGPEWLADTRYTVTAVVGESEAKQFRALLREELTRHLQLRTHREMREFDVFVLRSSGPVRLERAAGRNSSIWIGRREARFRNSSMQDIAAALQNILRKPVLDRTGVTDTFNVALDWDEDPVSWLTADFRDRFGIEIVSARESLEALVIDDVRLDPAMTLLGHAGWLTRYAPRAMRETLARHLTAR